MSAGEFMVKTGVDAHQVGGRHYKTDYEHWNMVLQTGMGYLEASATKYLSRWQKKGGIADIQKALHYINKLIENVTLVQMQRRPLPDSWLRGEARRFCSVNKLAAIESEVIELLATWQRLDDLYAARDSTLHLLEGQDALAAGRSEPKPVPVEDSNRHGLYDPEPIDTEHE